jgi:translation initiation factor 2 subunit 3
MAVLRSFDVNRPGTSVKDIVGGIIGGSIQQGIFKIGDETEIRPGIRVEKGGKSYYEPLHSQIVSLYAGGKSVKEATSGGLVGMGTLLDPALTRADGLVGNMIGKPGHLPPVLENLTIEVNLLDRLIGTEELKIVEKIRTNEVLVLNTGTAVTAGVVNSARNEIVELSLRRPICIEPQSRLAISRRISDSWRLIGYGITRHE